MMDVTNKLPLRLRAVGWAAAVAVIPAYASARYVVDTKTAEHIGFLGLTNVPALTAMAVVAAVIPSYFLCWRLLDYEQDHDGQRRPARAYSPACWRIFCLRAWS